MKKILLIFAIAPVCFLFFSACKKEKSPAAEESPAQPDPWTYNNDLQSSKDISFSTYAIADIDMICAFMGENFIFNHFYVQMMGSTNTVTTVRDPMAKVLVMSFNKTRCADGKTRDGSVFLQYGYDPVINPNANPNANYYRDFGYVGRITLSEYKVDNWKIALFSAASPAFITNKLVSSSYNPAATNLTWEIVGKFKFFHPTDSTKNIVWDGKITKTLENTGDPNVFAADKQSFIKWNLAKVHYSGTVSGTTSAQLPFTFVISDTDPVKRDFTCTFTPTVTPDATQFHPFIAGAPTATISNFHPRTINYGPAQACDNSGTVTFKGETYNVDFD